ncbi:MAG: phosphodiester glycosidase family protein [Clostridia bacterium]|nr:phosphodiester glycosidase family protein [Clostridia bacterium]
MKKASAKTIVPAVLLIVVTAAFAVVTAYALSLKNRNEVVIAAAAPQSPSPEIAHPLRTAVPETPSPAPTLAPIPADPADDPVAARLLSAPFWSEGGISFENGYKSPTLSVTVTTYVDSKTFSKALVYYVADIYVSDVTQIRTAAANGTFSKGGSGKMQAVSKRENALVAISGDYYSVQKKSIVIRNGEVYRKSIGSADICLLLRTGEMETIRGSETTLNAVLERDPWQAWQFGPSLLTEGGRARTSFPKTSIAPGNPRSCIGYYEPGHYCFVLVDGRQKASRGLTLKELAVLMESLGCKKAYNLDGGASAHMYWQNRILNHPSGGGRKISDIIYVAKEDYPSARFYYGKAGSAE